MSMRVAVLSFILFLSATPLFAREKTDVLVMKNGDHLTCEIKGLDSGRALCQLRLHPEYAIGAVVESRLHRKQTAVPRQDRRRLRLYRHAEHRRGRGQAASEDRSHGSRRASSTLLPAKDVVRLAQTSDKFWQRFSGDLDSGIIYSKGNETTQYNLGARLAYLRERWSGSADYTSTLSSSSGSESAATRNQLNLVGMRLLRWNNWFYTGLGSFLQSSEQDIRLQSNLGGGIRALPEEHESHDYRPHRRRGTGRAPSTIRPRVRFLYPRRM